MIGRIGLLAGVTLLVGPDARPSVPFALASVHFEQNATDGDVEVVFEVKGGDEGLAKLAVVSPDGRTVVAFTAPDASTLGIRQFRFESPEPGDAARLKAAYPEGIYSFDGTTAAGAKLHARARLTHALPAPAAVLRPAAGARGVDRTGLVLSWTPVKDAAAYVVYVEQHALGFSLTARLPGSVARFAVPDGVLAPGTEYQMGIGTVTAEGNTSFVETTFTTAGKT